MAQPTYTATRKTKKTAKGKVGLQYRGYRGDYSTRDMVLATESVSDLLRGLTVGMTVDLTRRGTQSRTKYHLLEKAVRARACALSSETKDLANERLAAAGSELRFRGFEKAKGSEPDLFAKFYFVSAPRTPLYLPVDIKGTADPLVSGRLGSEKNLAALSCAGTKPGKINEASRQLWEGRIGLGYLIAAFEVHDDGHVVGLDAFNFHLTDPEAWHYGSGGYPEYRGTPRLMAQAKIVPDFDSARLHLGGVLRVMKDRKTAFSQAQYAKSRKEDSETSSYLRRIEGHPI